MKIAILFLPFLCLLHSNILWAQNPSIGNPPDWNWIQTIGGNSGSDHGQSIVGDAQGNFFIGGDFSGVTQFDNTSLTTQGLVNGFVAKCDPAGAVLWTKQFRSSASDGKVYVSSITADPDGNLVVLGHFRGGNLKLGTQTYFLASDSDLFLAKFGPSGTLVWLITEGTFFTGGLEFGKILADNDGSIFMLTSDWLRKYSSTGTQIWQQSNPSQSVSDIALKGNTLLLVGQFYNQIQLDNDFLSATDAAIFLTHVEKPNGAFFNASILASGESGAYLFVNSIAMLNETDFVLSGNFSFKVSIDQFPLSSPISDQFQYFIAKFVNGACSWAVQSTGPGIPQYGVAQARTIANTAGDAYFFGNKNGTITFGNNTVYGTESGFLAKLDGLTGNTIALTSQPAFYDGWSDGQNLLQIGAPFYNITVRSTNNAGSILFNRSFDSDSGVGVVTGVKNDQTGIFISANTSAKTTFLGQTTYNPAPSIVVAKLNHAGNALLWQQTIAGASSYYTFGHSLWLDKAHEKLYLTGIYLNAFYFGAQLVDTSGGNGVFVAQMGTDGSFGWIKTFPKSTLIGSVITDAQGTVIANGTFSGDLQLGNITLSSAGYDDIFWMKISANGLILQAQRMGGESTDYESYAGVDALGNLYLSGEYSSENIDFNGSNQITRASGDGLLFHVKFAPDGQILWIKNFGNTDMTNFDEYHCFSSSVEADAAGNSFITGFHGTSNFFGPIHLTSPYSYNNFVAKISPSGDPIWVKSFRTKRITYNFCEISLDEAGDCYIGAQFRDSIYFDAAPITLVGGSSARNAYVAKINGTDGSTIWAKTISGSEEAIANPVTISVYDQKSLFVSGYINDRLNFDAQSINTNNGRKGFFALIGQTIVVGTEQPSADAFFITVSPNPTAETVTVSNASEQASNLLLEIFDASGELVATQTLSNFTGKTSFDLSTSPAGVYFLKASSQDGQQILRVVKN